jgi:hypothetical protein
MRPMAVITSAALLFAGLADSATLALTFDDGPDMADEVGLVGFSRGGQLTASVSSRFARRDQHCDIGDM